MTVKEDISTNKIFEVLDLWILSRLYITIDQATKSFLDFEYCDARVAIEEFFWKDLCDNYLELVKSRVYNIEPETAASRQSGICTICHLLKTIYRLFAPFIPHICDELNQAIFGGESINKPCSWPKLENYSYLWTAVAEGNNVITILELVRKYKSTNKLPLNAPLYKLLYAGCELSGSAESDLKNAANTKVIDKSTLDKDAFYSEDGRISIMPVHDQN
jgi:valyl-tRNA synthetase